MRSLDEQQRISEVERRMLETKLADEEAKVRRLPFVPSVPRVHGDQGAW